MLGFKKQRVRLFIPFAFLNMTKNGEKNMPNIVLTDICNLKCPYCFANEFVNKSGNPITEENFRKAVDFILTGGDDVKIGLIGGEPTLHPKFSSLLRILKENEKAKHVVIYTNGIEIDRYFEDLHDEKFRFLINCNSPKDIGSKQFEKLSTNIAKMTDNPDMKNRICLGINLYRPDMDYSYIINLLEKHKLKRVRISITVPNYSSERNINAFDYFMSMKKLVLDFFKDALKVGAKPHFDCNKIPGCLFTDEDVSSLEKSFESAGLRVKNMDVVLKNVSCSPVVDICQDLTAIRCFGLSEYTKVKIEKFRNLTELVKYYENMIDAFAFNCSYTTDCADCFDRITKHCNGGCLAFKIDKILEVHEICLDKMRVCK